jgi:hypothetical protein
VPAGITIARSAANRVVVFGAAGALKNHEPSRWRRRDASAADLIRLPSAGVRTEATII